MGDEAADLAAAGFQPPLTDGDPRGVGFTYMYRKSNYALITDNVMDLSHIDHLHGEIITTPPAVAPGAQSCARPPPRCRPAGNGSRRRR